MLTRRVSPLKRIYSHLWYFLITAFILMMNSPVYAVVTERLPWDTPAQKVQEWLTGSVAKIVAIVLIAISGIMFANGEHGSALRRMMGIIFGISIAVGAVTIYISLGFSGAEV